MIRQSEQGKENSNKKLEENSHKVPSTEGE